MNDLGKLEKSCENCRHFRPEERRYPCITCRYKSNWVPGDDKKQRNTNSTSNSRS